MARRRTKGGYRSKLEARIAALLKEAGVKYTYESYQYTYTVKTPIYRSRCGDCGSDNLVSTKGYTPDFFLQDGKVLEVKGRFTSHDRKKMKAIVEQYPDETFIMVFQSNNKLYKNAKQRYLEWCESNGIKACLVKDLKEYLKL